MLYMILCPDVQEKVLQEIEKVLPEGQDATVEDMDRMLYTQATILEAQRFGKIVPLLVPKRITQDFCYRNYVFKKVVHIYSSISYRKSRMLKTTNYNKFSYIIIFPIGYNSFGGLVHCFPHWGI